MTIVKYTPLVDYNAGMFNSAADIIENVTLKALSGYATSYPSLTLYFPAVVMQLPHTTSVSNAPEAPPVR